MRTALNDVKIRRAKKEDLPVLLEFEQGIIRDERPFDPTIAPDPIRYYPLDELIYSQDACVLVAEVNEQLVASGMARRWKSRAYLDHSEHGFLGFMYTRPSHRGQGINKLLVDELVQWCRSQQLFEVRLTVYSGNQSAVRAYEKAGFTSHIIEMRLPRNESEK
jgi:GNAT superfamily N-acetyltransferase